MTANQQAAIAGGADIYHGLGGSDVVTLPDVGNYQLTSNVTWDPTKTFVETDTAGQHVTITSGNGFENIKVGDGNDTINIGASGGNVTIGSGSNTVTSSATTSTADPNANATTVGFTGINFNSGVTFTHSAPANPLGGGTYSNANLSIGNLFFTYQGGENVNVSAGSQLDTFSNVQFVQSGDAGGSGSKLPLDAIRIVVSLDSDGFGTISATDDGQPISGLQSNVTCAFDQLMPVPNGTYDVDYRTNAGTGDAFEFSDYNGVSWFGPNRTNIQLHIGNNPGDSIGCIVVGNNGNASDGSNSQFWNTLTTTFMNTLTAGMSTATGQFGQTFYQLPIPITLTVQDSPVQPTLHIEQPSTVGNTSNVDFKIDGLGTSAPIDKDINVFFAISGANASTYSVTGSNLENKGTLADGSVLFEDTIVRNHDHGATTSGSDDAIINISYTGSSSAALTIKLVPDSPEGTYYDGTRYSTTHGPVSDYAPPSQPLIDLNALSQTVTFTGQAANGKVIDGYISGATVFADANGNGKLDPGEVSTTTDANGNFTLTGGTGPLVAFGGTDVSTGLPFKGVLEAPAGSSVIDPLTTLLSGIESSAGLSLAAAQQEVLAALGLSSGINLTTLDPIAGVKSGDAASAAAYAAEAKVIDTVEVIATTMTSAGVSFSKAYADAFAALDATINALPAGQTLNLSDQGTITALINSVALTEGVHPTSAATVAAAIAASNAELDQALTQDGASASLLADVAIVQIAALAPPATVVPVIAPTITAQTIQNDYLAITQTALPLDQAATEANAINAGTTTETLYVNSLLSQVAYTTLPAVAVEGSMYGAVGSSAEITLLATQFLPTQLGWAIQNAFSPEVFACQVLGMALAFGNENGATTFANNFGPSNAAMPNTHAGDAAFAAAAASAVFGSAQNAGTATNILGWVSYFEAFFTQNGIDGIANPTAAQIDLAARGTAWGDAVGVAVANNLGPLAGQTTNFLEDAAQGTAMYSASLASQLNPAPLQGSATASVATTATSVQVTGVAAPVEHIVM